MMTSAWASECIDDQSQHRYKDGRDMNSVNSTNSANTAKNGKKINYHASPPAPPTPAYPNAFQSGQIDSSPTTGNTNTMNTMSSVKATKNGKKDSYHSFTAAPTPPSYPSVFQSGEIDSSSVRTNPMIGVNDMNGMDSANSSKNGKKGNHHPLTEFPAIPAYSSASQSGEIDSTSIRRNSVIGVNRMNGMDNVNSAKSGKKGNYFSPTAGSATAGYPSAFESGDTGSGSSRTDTMISAKDMSGINTVNSAKGGKKGNNHCPTAAPGIAGYPSTSQSNGIDSRLTPNKASDTNGMDHVNNIDTINNVEKGNYHSPTTAPAITGYPSAFESGEIDSSSFRHHTNTLNNGSGVNTVNRTKNGKKDDKHSFTVAPGVAGYPSSFQSSEFVLGSTSNHTSSLNNMTKNVNDVNRAKYGKKGTQHQLTAAPATPANLNAFQSSETGSSSNVMAAAWEEHIDEATNRKYFYNSITGGSTWGEPNATVKKPPPPPLSPPPISLIAEKREQDHWFRIGGKKERKMWFNDITQMSQIDRPDCLRKYI